MPSERPTRLASQMQPSCRRALVLGVAMLVLVGCAAAPEAGSGSTSERAALHDQTFEKVWTELRDHYYDPTFGGKDWKAICDGYRAKLGDLGSDAELHQLLNRMVNELGQSHLGVISPEAYVSFDSDDDDEAPDEEPGKPGSKKPGDGARPSSSKKRGDVGLEARMVEGRLTVVSVREGGPAETAGLRPGFVLVRIGRREIREVIARLTDLGRDDGSIERTMEGLAASRWRGAPGDSLTVAYLDGENSKHEVSLVREPSVEKRVGILNLPPMATGCDVRTLEGGVGYVAFNIFFLQLMKELREGILSFREAPGLILDLRGNPGGIAFMSVSVAALLLDERCELGTMRTRQNLMRFPVFPVSDPVRAPVVLLMDAGSGSTSEMMAAGLQEIGRVLVVGAPSAGAVLPSVLKTLPTGARLQYPIANFLTPKGLAVEGKGVIPDVFVPLSRASLLRGQDNVIEAARKLLLERGTRQERTP